jgi:hypothetical protein
MPSFDVVNYALRPNKNVERKLVFSSLRELDRRFDLSGHRYVGLGSVWFVDFVLAHKSLGITDMVSIERDQIGHRRAEFNRPLSCIQVLLGETSAILPDVECDDKPLLLWLDYDSGIGGSALQDIANVLPKLQPGSVFVVTLSAKKDDLELTDGAGQQPSPEEVLRGLAGDLVPAALPSRRLRQSDYPRLVAEIVSNQFESIALRTRGEASWVQLFDIEYVDSTPMVTVGGFVSTPTTAAEVQHIVASERWRGKQSAPIALPPLTIKEKMALDSLLPSPTPPTQQRVHRLGFALRQEQIVAYHRHYRDYPVFGEMIG